MEILSVLTYEYCEIAFQVLRVYAISGRRWQFALVVGALNIYPFFFEIVRVCCSSVYV